MTVYIHARKRSADAKPYWRVLIDGKLYCTENSDAEGKAMVAKLKVDPQYKGKTITSVEASTTAGAGVQSHAPRKLFGDARDHRLDYVTPATDAERRDRIQQVVRNCGVTSAIALRWLEAEEWIVDTCVRELNHAKRLGFTVDAAGQRASPQQVNTGLNLAGEINQLLVSKGEDMGANEIVPLLTSLSAIARALRSVK